MKKTTNLKQPFLQYTQHLPTLVCKQMFKQNMRFYSLLFTVHFKQLSQQKTVNFDGIWTWTIKQKSTTLTTGLSTRSPTMLEKNSSFQDMNSRPPWHVQPLNRNFSTRILILQLNVYNFLLASCLKRHLIVSSEHFFLWHPNCLRECLLFIATYQPIPICRIIFTKKEISFFYTVHN